MTFGETTRQAGADLIAAERRRQLGEGWTFEHDDEHTEGDLAYVAAWLAAPPSARVFVDLSRDRDAPESYSYVKLTRPSWGVANKPLSRVEALTKAGALIAAEIDRLLREGVPS